MFDAEIYIWHTYIAYALHIGYDRQQLGLNLMIN